jgi:hypothetical protein
MERPHFVGWLQTRSFVDQSDESMERLHFAAAATIKRDPQMERPHFAGWLQDLQSTPGRSAGWRDPILWGGYKARPNVCYPSVIGVAAANGKTNRERRSTSARRTRPAVAGDPDVVARRRHRSGHRPPLRPRRIPAAAVASVLGRLRGTFGLPCWGNAQRGLRTRSTRRAPSPGSMERRGPSPTAWRFDRQAEHVDKLKPLRKRIPALC